MKKDCKNCGSRLCSGGSLWGHECIDENHRYWESGVIYDKQQKEEQKLKIPWRELTPADRPEDGDMVAVKFTRGEYPEFGRWTVYEGGGELLIVNFKQSIVPSEITHFCVVAP